MIRRLVLLLSLASTLGCMSSPPASAAALPQDPSPVLAPSTAPAILDERVLSDARRDGTFATVSAATGTLAVVRASADATTTVVFSIPSGDLTALVSSADDDLVVGGSFAAVLHVRAVGASSWYVAIERVSSSSSRRRCT